MPPQPMRRPFPGPHRDLMALPWPQVQAAAEQPGSTVIWPWGALEQHGPQLPLGTDAYFADRVVNAVLERLPQERPIWRLPLQSLGFSPEHQGFCGTLSLSATQVIDLVMAVGGQLAGAGFSRLLLLNAHGGQIGLLQAAARQLRASFPQLAVLPCFLWRGPEGVAELLPDTERAQGLHAGLAETSLMLHLASELVQPERPRDGLAGPPPPEGWSLEGAAPCAWLTSDLSRSGVIGDSAAASAELGARLFERLVDGWVRRCESLLASSWPPTDFPLQQGSETPSAP